MTVGAVDTSSLMGWKVIMMERGCVGCTAFWVCYEGAYILLDVAVMFFYLFGSVVSVAVCMKGAFGLELFQTLSEGESFPSFRLCAGVFNDHWWLADWKDIIWFLPLIRKKGEDLSLVLVS